MGKFERRLGRQGQKKVANGEERSGSAAWRGLERLVAEHALPKAEREDEVIESRCGHCGMCLDGATHADGIKPKAGDFAVCWSCAGVNRFDRELQLVRVTESEVDALDPEEVELEVLHEMRALIRAASTKSYERGRGEA